MELSQKITARAALIAVLSAGVLAKAESCPPDQSLKEHAVQESEQRGPYAKGMLWEIKPSGAPASYLFGTIHLAGLTRLPPAVALALVKAEVFVAETALDPDAMAYFQRQMYSDAGPNLATVFEQPLRERLLALLADYGFERQTARTLKPWAAFTLLSRPKPTGAPTLDQTLELMARTREIPVRGLQSVDELVAALEGMPLDSQRQIVIDTVCNHALIEQQAQDLIAEYFDEDLAGMLAVSGRFEPHDPTVAKMFRERILDNRNDRMLERLEPYLEQGGAFVAVGALHLPGEEGLLRGLKARDYRINAVHW